MYVDDLKLHLVKRILLHPIYVKEGKGKIVLHLITKCNGC